MAIKQISAFVENKSGKLAEITGYLNDAEINIRAFAISDTADFGILRMIVSDPERAEEILQDNQVSVSITEVLVVSIPDVRGSFAQCVKVLAQAGENIEYAYAFLTPEAGCATVIIRVDDPKVAAKALSDAGIRVLEQSEII